MRTRLCVVIALLTLLSVAADEPVPLAKLIYNPGKLKPVDSRLKVKVGDKAPDFSLPSVRGPVISLKDYRGKKHVVISFVPAAFTPVCSAQWPGYNLVLDMFEKHDAVLLGISSDNIPSLHAWVQEMEGL